MADRTGPQAAWLTGMWLALFATAANAQMPTVVPEEAPATRRATPVAAAPAGAGSAEELPWLATTTAGPEKAKGSAAATPVDAAAPNPAAKKPAAKTTQKCEAQEEEGCRAATNCAWVAAIPQGDGKVVPARCAERKVQAPAKKKKPAVAAKPKPAESPAATAAEKAPEVKVEATPRTSILEVKGEPPPAPAPPLPAETPKTDASQADTAAAVAPVAPAAETSAETDTDGPPATDRPADKPLSIPGLVIVE